MQEAQRAPSTSSHLAGFLAKSHLGGAALQHLDEHFARRAHEASAHAGPDLAHRLDDLRLAAREMGEGRVDIVHGHAEMVDAFAARARLARLNLRRRERRNEQIDTADAQIHAPRPPHDFGVQAAREPGGRGFGVGGTELQMIPSAFDGR
ncbi:hypothetical protein PT2222_70121 [Paraburkholderia tropica]